MGARWKAHQRVVIPLVGVRGGQGAGASWKAHQRVVKRLVGRREGVGVRVPVKKDTNESLNDSLEAG